MTKKYLNKMLLTQTVKQLKAMATSLGVEKLPTKKQDLVDAILVLPMLPADIIGRLQ